MPGGFGELTGARWAIFATIWLRAGEEYGVNPTPMPIPYAHGGSARYRLVDQKRGRAVRDLRGLSPPRQIGFTALSGRPLGFAIPLT